MTSTGKTITYYTQADNQKMVDYIIKHKAHDRMKTLSLFKEMEKDQILPGRTAKGLINHFRKITSFQLQKYCNEENFKIFERVRKRKPTTPNKNRMKLADIMFEDDDIGDTSDFLPDQFKNPPKKQQKIAKFFSRRIQSQEAGPSQVSNTHENVGQTSTQTKVTHRSQPILNKNKITDDVWLESKPASRTKLVSKSQPLDRNLPIKLVPVRIGSQETIPKSSLHLNEIPDFCMNTEMYSKTEDRHILESLVRHVSHASDLESDDFWRNLKRWVLVPGRSCESVRARFRELQKSNLSNLGVSFTVLNKLNLTRNANQDPSKTIKFNLPGSQIPDKSKRVKPLQITRPDSPHESYDVDNDSQLNALLEESKYFEPRTNSPPAEVQQTARNQYGLLRQTTRHIPLNQTSTSKPVIKNMETNEPSTSRQETRQTWNQTNDQQQHFKSQEIQSKPAPSSPAKSLKPFRKAITGVAMSQQSQQIPECIFVESATQEELSAPPRSKRRSRTAISECSGITNFQVYLTRNSKTIDLCAQKIQNPTKLRSAEESHHVHVETTTIQRQVLSHTFRSSTNNESKAASVSNKETRLKAMNKVLLDDCSEDSGSETRKEQPVSQDNNSQANSIHGSIFKSNMVTRHTQVQRDVVKKNQPQKEQTELNPAAKENTDIEDQDTVLAPNFDCVEEQQISEPENIIYSSDSISDSEDNEVPKSKNKNTPADLKSKKSIFDQFHDDCVEIAACSQDSELLAHMATSQGIDTAISLNMNTQMTNTPDKNSITSFHSQKIDQENDFIFEENSQKDGSISSLLVSQSVSHCNSSAVKITTEGALKIQKNNTNIKAKTVPEVVYLAPQGSSNQNQDHIKYIRAKPAVPQQQVVNDNGQVVTYPIINHASMPVFNPNVIFMIPEQPQQLQQPISNVYNIYNSNTAKFKKNKKRKLRCKAKCSKWVVTNVSESSESEEEKVQTKKQKKSCKRKILSKKKVNKKTSKKKQVSRSESENEVEKMEDKSHLNKTNRKIINKAVVLSKQAVEVKNIIKRHERRNGQRKSKDANVGPPIEIKTHQKNSKMLNSSQTDSENEGEVKEVCLKYINTRSQQKLIESQTSQLEISNSNKEQNLKQHENPNAISKHKQETNPNKYTELKKLEKLVSINEDTLLTSDSSFCDEQLNATKDSKRLQFHRVVPASDSSSESNEEVERQDYVNTRLRRWKVTQERKQEQRRSPRINIGVTEMERLAKTGNFI